MKRTSLLKTIPGLLRHFSAEYLKSNGFKQPGSLLDEAAALSLDHNDLEKFHRRHFINKDGSVNMQAQAAFARVHTVERTVSTYLPILEQLALEADSGALAADLKNHVQALKEGGIPLDQAVLIFNKLLKIAPSLTPHPTENIAPGGVILLQNLLEAAEAPISDRKQAIETAIKALFDAPVFGAVRKASVMDEGRQARIYKLAHIKAVNAFDRRLEDALEAAYGTRPKINSNTALRNWDKDTDGKDNSEGFAMIAGLAMDQVDSLNLALDNIAAALDDPLCPPAIKDLAAKFKTVRGVVEPIYQGAGNAVEVLALLSPEDRAKAYPLMYDRHFKGLKRKLSGAYEGIGDKMRGLGLYRESCKILGLERDNPALSPEARAGLDEAFRTIQKLGFALSKSQTRISYNVYMRMLDNLFAAQPAILQKILTDEERDDIAAAGGFSGIADPEQQRILLNEMYHNIQRLGLEEKFYKALRAANPMTMAASGFPDQGFSVCDVLDMRSVFQLMYEEGIISDGGPCSFEIQKLMGLVSGNGLMKHMPLFENLDTYMQAPDLSEKFMALDAGESGKIRFTNMPQGIGTGFKGYSVIVPASDSAKEGGDGAKLVGLIGERSLFAHTIKRGESVQQMNGAGASLGRSIGDHAIIRRMGAQELSVFTQARGKALDLSDPQDAEMARMALSIMYTEQGRGNRLNALTPGQILGTLTSRTTEALQDILDLTGAVPANTFIDKPTPLTPAQRRAFEALPRQKMRRHFIMRHARGPEGGDKILDRIAQTARGPHMIPFTNIMSRAAAKNKNAGMTSERAIGNDISQSVSELFFSGFYGTGTALAEHFEKIGSGAESFKDLQAIIFHPEMQHAIMAPGLANAARFNAEYLFSRISRGTQWKLKDIITVGASALFVKTPDGGHEIRYQCPKGQVSPEEAYLAKIAYDRLLFLALTEEILSAASARRKPDTDIKAVLKKFTKGTKGLNIGPGKRTLAQWPMVGIVTAEHAKNAPGLALWRGMNAALESGLAAEPAQLMPIAASYRAGTLPHWPLWQEGGPGTQYRKKARPVLDILRDAASCAPGSAPAP